MAEKQVCMQCQGTGKCSGCDGTGQMRGWSEGKPYIADVAQGEINPSRGQKSCPRCMGTGTCQACVGAGVVTP